MHFQRRAHPHELTNFGPHRIPDIIAVSISGRKTRALFDRYNIISEADVQGAANRLEQYAERRKKLKPALEMATIMATA